jgi:16S rRNA (guanine527-N7)-methyltransferase
MNEQRNDAGAITPAEVAELAGRPLTEAQARGLADYIGLLLRWNAVMNLVGPSDPRTVLTTLVADSFHLADLLGELDLPDSPRTLDLGAGAGLPGIPLRLFWTAGEYWLVEARQKRAAFLQNASARLGLPRTRVFGGRVEHLPARLLPADLVLGRAFMPWRDYLGLAATLVGEGGTVLVMANEPPPNEPGPLPGGMALTASRSYALAGGDRYFWVFTPASSSR